MNRIELLEKLRKESIVPVILLSVKEQEMDIVDGLKSGADDYITSHFVFLKLLPKLKAFCAGAR